MTSEIEKILYEGYEDSHSVIEVSLDQLRIKFFSIMNEEAYSLLH